MVPAPLCSRPSHHDLSHSVEGLPPKPKGKNLKTTSGKRRGQCDRAHIRTRRRGKCDSTKQCNTSEPCGAHPPVALRHPLQLESPRGKKSRPTTPCASTRKKHAHGVAAIPHATTTMLARSRETPAPNPHAVSLALPIASPAHTRLPTRQVTKSTTETGMLFRSPKKKPKINSPGMYAKM